MRRALILLASLTLIANGIALAKNPLPARTPRVISSFDADWRFLKGDAPGAEQSAFDDSLWRRLAVPHDWSIEGPFAETAPAGGAGAFLPNGIGWYRKHFTLPQRGFGQKFFLEFHGVMANSQVWLNGVSLGERPNGYVSFRYELTDHLLFGEGLTNVLAARTDNSAQPASRWYTGAGIYRHVRFVTTGSVHLEAWSTFITTSNIGPNAATVCVSTWVTNQSFAAHRLVLNLGIVSPKGKTVRTSETQPQTLAPNTSVELRDALVVNRPQLWSLETPTLYYAQLRIVEEASVLDEEEIPFGIREFKFEPATGFWLNGRNLKIRGVCLHHDAGALGAAVPLSAWSRRLQALKQIGCNAIRTSHNPVAPDFLDLCDRMGFLVMDEMFDCWTIGKVPCDYHRFFKEWSAVDLADTVRRDRNHPSIVLYSAGNEIRDTTRPDLAKGLLRGLLDVFHQNDPTRPVTQGLFRPNVSHDYDNGLADMLDVVGQNYRENEILAAHQARPERKIIGTENTHDRKVWLALRDTPPYAGQFLWTGIDYLGEARNWPTIAAGSGLLDRTGTPRPRAFERQSWWSQTPMVYAVRRTEAMRESPADPGFYPLARLQQEFADWTPVALSPHSEEVEIYSNCEQVELWLNGSSLGVQALHPDASPRVWKVNFAPGLLKAVGKNRGRTVAVHELRTAGSPSKLLLHAECSRLAYAPEEVCYVKASVADQEGVLVPSAGNLVDFKLSGSGHIVAVDSGDNSSHESFQDTRRRAFQGVCFAVLRADASSGHLTLAASAPGLQPATVTIKLSPSGTSQRYSVFLA